MQEKVLNILAKSGPIALVAGACLYVILVEIRPAMADLKAEHAEMRAEEVAESANLIKFMEKVDGRLETSNYLQRRQCINEARTSVDREACARDRD